MMGGNPQAMLQQFVRSNPQMAATFGNMTDAQLEQYGQRLMQTNPQFADFVRRNQGKPLQQVIAQEMGFRQ